MGQPLPLEVFSDFDSANATVVHTNRVDKVVVKTNPDANGKTRNRTWFYFALKHLRRGKTAHISIQNLNPQTKLFKHNYRPVFRALPSRPKWARLPCAVATQGSKAIDDFEITFSFTNPANDDDIIFFAWCFPLSYEENQTRLAHLDRIFGMRPLTSCGDEHVPKITSVECDHLLREAAVAAAYDFLPRKAPLGIYYHRELLAKSLGGRRVELITISGTNGMLPASRPGRRSFSNKKAFIISARVHPGEVPASHVFDGALALLLRESDPRARRLRELFVFYLVPMLNPDGVALGRYRADTLGANLNRLYGDHQPETAPSVHAVMNLVKELHSQGNLEFYIDLHAHANRRGCFLYGNFLPSEKDRVETAIYARYVAANSRHLDLEGCDFSAKNMFRRERRDGNASAGKEGSGRVGVYSATGIVHAYTLECNYNTGRYVNAIAPLPNTPFGRAAASVSPTRGTVSRARPTRYDPDTWAEVGRALLIAVLDLLNQNPASRVGSRERVARLAAAWVRNRERKAALRAAKHAARASSDGEEGDEEEDEDDNDEEEDADDAAATREIEDPVSNLARMNLTGLKARA